MRWSLSTQQVTERLLAIDDDEWGSALIQDMPFVVEC